MTKQIPLFTVVMAPEAGEMVKETLYSGFLGEGPRVAELEERLKERFGVKYLTLTNSGTSAEHLSWKLLEKPNPNTGWEGLKSEDEVLCTALTCTASNFPVILSGFKIKWVDINPETLNMDLDDLERKITKSTKAIQLVHWSGSVNNLDRIKEIQNKTKELLGFKPAALEDCAHAFGSKYKGKYLGNHGNICTFSAQAIKHWSMGDGGFITVPYHDLWKRADLLKWYGIDRRGPRTDFRCEQNVEEISTKWHLNDVCATIGLANLKYIDEVIARHVDNAKYYNSQLYNCDGVELPFVDFDCESSYWIYSMLVEDRPSFTKWMKECGIMVSQVHERNDKHTALKEFRSHLPNLDKVIGKLTHIPVHSKISKEDREYIVDCIKKGW